MPKNNQFLPVLSIIILNFNTQKLLEQLLVSIARYDRRLVFSPAELARRQQEEEIIPAEIIVIDNNSQDGSAEYLQHFNRRKKKGLLQRLRLRVVLNKKNVGFGAGNNQGMRMARGEYLLLLNSDTVMVEGAISQSLLWLASHPEYDLIGCRLLNKDLSPQPSVGVFPTLPRVFQMLFLDRWGAAAMKAPSETGPADWVMGAFMLLRGEVFRRSGGFDEGIFMYMDEVEWCYRLRRLGFRIGFYRDAKVVHLGGASSPEGRKTRILHIYRGLLYFYRRHFSFWQQWLLRLFLFTKALLAWIIGKITGNNYLKETYGEALRIALKE